MGQENPGWVPFFDTIQACQGRCIVGEKALLDSEEIFQNHFPGYPIWPAAFFVQACSHLAQAHVWMVSDFRFTTIVAKVEKFQFFFPGVPGNVVRLQVEWEENLCIALRDDKLRAKCLCSLEGEGQMAKGVLILKRFDFSSIHHEKGARALIHRIMRSEACNDGRI